MKKKYIAESKDDVNKVANEIAEEIHSFLPEDQIDDIIQEFSLFLLTKHFKGESMVITDDEIRRIVCLTCDACCGSVHDLGPDEFEDEDKMLY